MTGGAGTINVTGVITNGTGTGAGSVTKNDAGSLVLSNANTYTGATTVNSGILQIQNSQALGLGDGTSTSGTTVNSGGELQVNGTFTIANEWLSLNGTGVSGSGALNALSGTATFEGPITLAGPATVSTNSGATLALGDTTLSTTHPAITGSSTLTTIGGGTTTIVDAINTGVGGLTVSSGTTVLNNPTANPSTYGGATTVTGGNLQVGVLGIGSTGTGGGTPGAVNVGGTSLAPATLSGTGQVIGAATISSGSTVSVVAPGDTGGTGIGTLYLPGHHESEFGFGDYAPNHPDSRSRRSTAP